MVGMDIRLQEFNRREVLQYLLWRGGKIEPKIDRMIDDCMAETIRVARPRCVWRVMHLDRENNAPEIAFSGENIRSLLADCDRVILFAATLGTEFEMLIRRAQARDLTRALILDACGNAAIERVCDQAVLEIQKTYPTFRYLTDRFSPGYGDLDIRFQQEMLMLTDAPRKIGLTMTDTFILVPRKSVTALIGVANCPQKRRFRGCAYCAMFENCSFRKAGKTCGEE
jgi:hypothetical protein